MNFITGLPPSKNFSNSLTIVDHFCKMTHLVPLVKLPSTKELGEILSQEVFLHHGLPLDFVSDLGPQFI